MDIKAVRDLIQLMVDNDLSELEVQDGETRVALKRRGEKPDVPEVVALAPGAGVGAAAQPAASLPPESETQEDDDLTKIESPMVGTFYVSPDPESPPLVQVGSIVEPDTPVCIIEAMKVYNEIKAETAGVIEKIWVKNEEAVEFGQPLFTVRPTSNE
jgi:acetyl-CoA carboxylase biotin carboxyl carrier protein